MENKAELEILVVDYKKIVNFMVQLYFTSFTVVRMAYFGKITVFNGFLIDMFDICCCLMSNYSLEKNYQIF
jgi:hypothetical protein